MEAELEQPVALEADDEKMSSLNHAELQSHLSFLLRSTYRKTHSILTELDLQFASGKTRPDLCIFPKLTVNWTDDEIMVREAPLTTIEILSPEQSLNGLLERIYQKHFPAGVKSVWIVVPALQLISIWQPDRTQLTFTAGTATDPATGIAVNVGEVFEG